MKNKLVKQKVFINNKEKEGYFFTPDQLERFAKIILVAGIDYEKGYRLNRFSKMTPVVLHGYIKELIDEYK